jgi:hypothetical protein
LPPELNKPEYISIMLFCYCNISSAPIICTTRCLMGKACGKGIAVPDSMRRQTSMILQLHRRKLIHSTRFFVVLWIGSSLR